MTDTDRDDFSLQSAARANAAGRLVEWIEAFLSSEGSDNEVLAAALRFDEKSWTGPVLLRLDQLVPLAGPDDGADDDVIVPIDEGEWEGGHR